MDPQPFSLPPVFGSVYDRPPPPPRGPSLFGFDPAAGRGPVEGALQAVLPMLGEYLRTQSGGYGITFGSDANVATAQYAREYLQQLNTARTQGAQADQRQVGDLLRGLAAAVGHQPLADRGPGGQLRFAEPVERAIGRMSSDVQGMLPVLAAMFPDTLDRALPFGSMTVAAGSFVNAGRFVIDPATGRPVSENAGFAATVLDPLISRGPQATAGLGAGRLGQTYETLVRQGLIGSGGDLREQVRAREAAGGAFGIGMSGAQASDVQAGRVRERIEAYAQSVAAINDIFAENGRANAPMAELIKSLQTLTQGGLQAYDPRALARLARTIQGAGQLSGLSLEGLTELAAGAGATLARTGGHRALAAPIAVQAAAAGAVFADRGFGAPGPEGMSRDEFLAQSTRDQAGFAGSFAVNNLGAVLYSAQYAPAGSPLQAVAAAVQNYRAGQSTVVTLPNGKSIDLLRATEADYARLYTDSGLSADAFLLQRQAQRQNQAALVNNQGALRLGGQFQTAELVDTLFRMYDPQLARPGVDPTRLRDALFETARRGDVDSDQKLVAEVGKRLNLTPAQQAELGPMVGMLGQFRGTSGFNVLRAVDPTVRQDVEARVGQFEARGRDQAALQHLARRGWLANIGNTVRDMGFGQGVDWGAAFLKGIGLVTDEEARAARGLDPFANAADPFKFARPQAEAARPGDQGAGFTRIMGLIDADLRRPPKLNPWQGGAPADMAEDRDAAPAPRAKPGGPFGIGGPNGGGGTTPVTVNITADRIVIDGKTIKLNGEGTAVR